MTASNHPETASLDVVCAALVKGATFPPPAENLAESHARFGLHPIGTPLGCDDL